jgi:hypothetical protein
VSKRLSALPARPRAGDNNHTPPKTNPFATRGGGSACDVGTADRSVIIAAIGTCITANVLLTIGGSKGGRGYTVTVYADGEQHRDYAHDNDELRELLLLVIDAYASSAEDIYGLYGIEGRA